MKLNEKQISTIKELVSAVDAARAEASTPQEDQNATGIDRAWNDVFKSVVKPHCPADYYGVSMEIGSELYDLIEDALVSDFLDKEALAESIAGLIACVVTAVDRSYWIVVAPLECCFKSFPGVSDFEDSLIVNPYRDGCPREDWSNYIANAIREHSSLRHATQDFDAVECARLVGHFAGWTYGADLRPVVVIHCGKASHYGIRNLAQSRLDEVSALLRFLHFISREEDSERTQFRLRAAESKAKTIASIGSFRRLPFSM
jgi:hypothetical protein